MAPVCSVEQVVVTPQRYSQNVERTSFADLPCTAAGKEMISQLLVIMDENNPVELVTKKCYLEKLGAKLRENVHPLKFVVTVFSDETLKKRIHSIHKSLLPFKWDGLKDGLVQQMASEEKQGRCSIFAADFAAELHIPSEKVQPFFVKHDWEGLLQYLVERK